MGFTQTAQYVTISKRRCRQEPKNKLYILLCDRETMVVPVKSDVNPYTLRPWFAGGTPQFFGGSAESTERPILTVQREVAEESRGTLALGWHSQPLLSVPPTDSDLNTYSFYYSVEWSRNSLTWPISGLPPEQREMQGLVIVERSDMLPDWQDSVIISRLVHQTGTVNAPGINAFQTSHTARAFVTFIRDIWPGL